MKSAVAIIALVGFNTRAASAQFGWPPDDVCGNMNKISENTNGVDCVLCADGTNTECVIGCVPSPVCFCPGDDIDECCDENPCCDPCPREDRPSSCFVSFCDCSSEDCCETVCPPYVLIQGTASESGKKMCWEVRNGNVREHNKIVLGKCDGSDAQKFMLTPVKSSARGQSVKVHPKRKPEKVIVGVREAQEKGWLRIEDNDESPDQTQIFTAQQNGMVRLGSNTGVLFYYVTNQGISTDKGDPVMLSTGARLEKFEEHGDVIKKWEFVPST